MNVVMTPLEGIVIIEPAVFDDGRGYFMETYQVERYHNAGFRESFVQDNLSFSTKDTLRGLHFQIQRPQAKLVQAVTGEIFDVVVDIRPGSKTFGQWTGVLLSEQTKRLVFIPAGFAHGFCVLSPTAHFLYKCTEFYDPDDEGGIIWSDPSIGIEWPIGEPIISEKDRRFPPLKELLPDQLPGHKQ
jgi:dTDP-4-dehydrorhamnose 3,5-epimerase